MHVVSLKSRPTHLTGGLRRVRFGSSEGVRGLSLVVATTPLPGLGTAVKDVPANVQIFGRGGDLEVHDIKSAHGL